METKDDNKYNFDEANGLAVYSNSVSTCLDSYRPYLRICGCILTFALDFKYDLVDTQVVTYHFDRIKFLNLKRQLIMT